MCPDSGIGVRTCWAGTLSPVENFEGIRLNFSGQGRLSPTIVAVDRFSVPKPSLSGTDQTMSMTNSTPRRAGGPVSDRRIAYLLIQFVDMHGAPKVKLVPVECPARRRRSGSGVRRRGGLGDGARTGLARPLCPARPRRRIPPCPTSRASHGSPPISMSTANRTRIAPA